MIKDAFFSPCMRYRYVLLRTWDRNLKSVACFGLNPSTADANDDDPTIESLIRILKHNGYGGLYMMNLFALISPNPEDLRSAPDPLKDNDKWIDETLHPEMPIIFAWGAFKQAEYRAKKFIKRFPDALCLGKNSNGTPRHPLYKKATTLIVPFNEKS
jgi:hypothetical protein